MLCFDAIFDKDFIIFLIFNIYINFSLESMRNLFFFLILLNLPVEDARDYGNEMKLLLSKQVKL